MEKRLIEEIRNRPARFYRLPGDVIRDRRFNDGERLEILRAWLAGTEGGVLALQIENAIGELQARMPGHAAE